MDPGLSIGSITVEEQTVEHHLSPLASGGTPVGQKSLKSEENEYRQQA